MSENMEDKNIQSESEGEEEEINQEPNSTQINKDKKKKKKNKSKSNGGSKSQTQTQTQTQTKVQPQSAMAKLILERKRLQEEEDERVRKLQEEEDRKIKEEEERMAEKKRKEEEESEKKRKAKQDKIQAQKLAGTYKTKSEKEREKKNKEKLEQMKKLGIINEDGRVIMNQELYFKKTLEQNEDMESDTESEPDTKSNPDTKLEIEQDRGPDINFKCQQKQRLRCPLFTIMGHVDTGKTTLLDLLRNTSVQSHEVGGITQQIGSTLLTRDVILKQLKEIKNFNPSKIEVPGLLLVDTPGHEAFKGLRKLGSKLADIALVIIDIMHGLEPQTIESIKLLTESGIPFMFVLNKIDRLYGWNKNISGSIDEIIDRQELGTRDEFDTRFKQIKTQIMMQGINNELEWLNTSPSDTINVIPLSAITGQGIPDLLNTIITYSQMVMVKQIEWVNELECVAMEITNVEGYGYTLDCVLKNGQLTRGDIIKICTQDNKTILTKVKNILTVPENKDSKSNTKYISNPIIKESGGIKIVASDLEKTLIGSMIEKGTQVELDSYINLETPNLNSGTTVSEQIKLDSQGVAIFTSSQGSLESFVEFSRSNTELINPIQISYVSVGSVGKKDLIKFNLSNSSNSSNVIPENNCVLVFEVEIDKEAQQYAMDNNIQIFEDKTIYRLFNQYKEFALKQYEERKEKARTNTIFPCVLKIIESNVFNKKNPLIMGVEILEGTLHLGTPLIILPSKTFIGNVVGIQVNKQDVKVAKTSQSVCIKINNESNPNIMYGRQFGCKDLLYSNLTRVSVDLLKEYFKKDLTKEDIGLLLKLKKQIGF